MTRTLSYILVVVVIGSFFTVKIVNKALEAYDSANETISGRSVTNI